MQVAHTTITYTKCNRLKSCHSHWRYSNKDRQPKESLRPCHPNVLIKKTFSNPNRLPHLWNLLSRQQTAWWSMQQEAPSVPSFPEEVARPRPRHTPETKSSSRLVRRHSILTPVWNVSNLQRSCSFTNPGPLPTQPINITITIIRKVSNLGSPNSTNSSDMAVITANKRLITELQLKRSKMRRLLLLWLVKALRRLRAFLANTITKRKIRLLLNHTMLLPQSIWPIETLLTIKALLHQRLSI